MQFMCVINYNTLVLKSSCMLLLILTCREQISGKLLKIHGSGGTNG